MLDETQEAPEDEAPEGDAPEAEASDDAVDVADMGADVETLDEPAVSAEELMDIPDAPQMPGREPEELTYMIADEADTQAAADDAASDAGDADAGDADAGDADAGDADAGDADADS
jgi:hypothetical protein